MADTATIDQQFVEYLVKALVANPDKVKIERTIDERGVLLELYVEPEDLGRVIGRNGSTAKSIRTLLRALGVKNGARYNLKIVDTGDSRPEQTKQKAAPSDAEKPQAEADAVEDVPEEAKVEPKPQVTETEKPQTEDEDSLKRHRDELKEFTDLDI